MTKLSQRSPLAEIVHRLVAGGSAALMLWLVTLAASPELHEHAHGSHPVTSDDTCAVVTFANGVSLATGVVSVPVPELDGSTAIAVPVGELFLVPSRYLRQPERGPPVC